MSEPTVCAVMLTANRPEMARRAAECFRAQTYPAKCLAIWDTSEVRPFSYSMDLPANERCVEDISGLSIGDYRNRAADWVSQIANPLPDILIHWDDDDWSHPSRIAEQVALLQSSGADAVGYDEMLFWREPHRSADFGGHLAEAGEAWLYTGLGPYRSALGTSLCYWRRAWEKQPFESTSQGEDTRWLRKVTCRPGSSVTGSHPERTYDLPRMIATIHGGNTSTAYDPATMRSASEWRRVPEWDQYVKGVMER